MDPSTVAERHELEQELHVEIIPGTELMRDIGSHHFVKSRGSKHRVLVPQPSSDPSDPLNWSLDDVVQFTTVCILILGFSNFIWVPLSTTIGRRPVYILSQLLNIVSSIWRAKATSYGSFMGACILNGIGAGPAETIRPAVIADIFFLHNRGTWNTFYWVTYIGSLSLGPVIAGAMSLRTGWRSFWWFNTALLIAAFLMVVFLFPETKWPVRIPAHVEVDHHSSVDPTSADVKQESSTMHEHAAGNVEQETDIEDTSVKGKPSKQQWFFITPEQHSLKTLWIGFWTPWKLFAFPIVQFAALVVAFTGGVGLSINFTQTQKFQAPLYNFTSELVGFEAFAVFAGCLIGLFTAGSLSDWISARATQRNGGIREPEMRLPTLIPCVLIMILGNTIVAVGYARNWPREVIVIIGMTCSGIQITSLNSIASTYAIDSYRPVAGSLFVSITVYKNIWGYGFGKFIEPWIARCGIKASHVDPGGAIPT